MKLSLKFQGHDDQHQHTTQQQQLMTAKVPLTIFNHPFMSSISAATTTTDTNTNSEFSFSLSTNFQSGPSLKLSYFPTTSSSSSTPFSLSLKSGLGLLGSPRHSPLLFSATFTLSPSLTPLPSFSLHFKPQFGHFSLNKTVFSDYPIPKPYSPPTAHNNDNNNNNNGEFSKGLVSNGSSSSSSSAWHELKLEPLGASRDNTHVDNNNNNNNNDKYTGFVPDRSLVEKKSEKRGLSHGVALMARTVMPVTKGLLLNLRWGLNLPGDSGVKMPYLTVNKIGLERVNVEDVRKNNNDKGKETSESDLQLLKGMCFWMKRDMEAVERENREMKRVLDEMRMGVSASRNCREGGNGGGGGGVLGRKLSRQHSGEGSGDGEFERWRSKKGVREESEKKEQQKKQQSVVSDVESELQKAIKAAANSASS